MCRTTVIHGIEMVTFIHSFDVVKPVELNYVECSGPQGKLTRVGPPFGIERGTYQSGRHLEEFQCHIRRSQAHGN